MVDHKKVGSKSILFFNFSAKDSFTKNIGHQSFKNVSFKFLKLAITINSRISLENKCSIF